MFLVHEPSDEDVASFIASQKSLGFSYRAVGDTATNLPPGYKVDHNRIKLGSGVKVYEQAVEKLKSWSQFDLGWVTIVPAGVPIQVGEVVAIKARAYGTWSLSASRIVYLTNVDGPAIKKFGFAYGTLPDHVESGEERFTVEWHTADDDTVWYDILAFSRPRHALVRLSFPLARRLQKRFARDSMKRMLRD